MIKEKYYEFLKPEYVYIPFDDRTLLNIKLNMIVFTNKLLGKNTNNENIYSTCSGKLIDLKEINTVDGKINSMVIENDFREKRSKLVGMKRTLFSYKKEDLLKKLEEYSLNYFNNVKDLIVLVEYTNLIDNSDSYTLKENIDDILEVLDALQNILDLNLTIVVNSKDINSCNILNEHMGTFPNLKYEIVNKEYKNNSYNMLSKRINKNENSLVLTIDKIYEIYFAIKKNKNLLNKIITVSYNKQLINVNVKIGTKVEELLNYLNIDGEVTLYSNEKVKSNKDAIITNNLKSIIITK